MRDVKTIALRFMGRFGNCMFQYAFARGYAEKHGLRLETDPWIGQEVFEINDPPVSNDFPRMKEEDIPLGMGDVSFLSYAQNQGCSDFYSKHQVMDWFRLNHRWKNRMQINPFYPVAHYRSGDYLKSGYPVVSMNSIRNSVQKFGYDSSIMIVCEEGLCLTPDLPLGLQFLDDFIIMMKADILFRSNSTFSWWAGALGCGKVYSPRIDGLEGGKEHDNVQFEAGNHCRTADLGFISDIHLKP